MTRLLYVLAALMFLCGQHAFSQGTAKKELSAEAKEIAKLKLELLASQKATLEARSELLEAKSKLLELEAAIWNDSRDKLQLDMNALFDCNYDLDTRACKPDPKKE